MPSAPGGERAVNRRSFREEWGLALLRCRVSWLDALAGEASPNLAGFHFADVTAQAGIQSTEQTAEPMAESFFHEPWDRVGLRLPPSSTYDAPAGGGADIFLINGTDWPGHK